MPGPHDRARLSQKSRSSDVKVLAVDRGNLKSKKIRDEIHCVTPSGGLAMNLTLRGNVFASVSVCWFVSSW